MIWFQLVGVIASLIAGVCFLVAGEIGIGGLWITVGSLWGRLLLPPEYRGFR